MRSQRPRADNPAPRHALHWSIEERDGAHFDWCCLQCPAGSGSAPTYAGADSDAATHYRHAHEGQQQ